MSLVINSVTADTTGTIFLPVDSITPFPGQVTIVAASAVQIQASSGTTATGFTIPANVPITLNLGANPLFLKAPTGTVVVGYVYTTR